jgi:hypothetical protein
MVRLGYHKIIKCLLNRAKKQYNIAIISLGASYGAGGSRTLDLVMMRPLFYHYATALQTIKQ